MTLPGVVRPQRAYDFFRFAKPESAGGWRSFGAFSAFTG
jgi:hypothetical protein